MLWYEILTFSNLPDDVPTFVDVQSKRLLLLHLLLNTLHQYLQP